MRIARKRVKEYIEEEVILCDICNKDVEFALGIFDCSEVTIEARIGEAPHPSVNDTVLYQIDICPPCFMEKVKPAIENIGGKFREFKDNPHTVHYQKILEEEELFEWKRHDGEIMS